MNRCKKPEANRPFASGEAPSRDSSEARAEAVRAAVASARIEGVVITAETQALFDEYVSGTLDCDETVKRVLTMYGPGATPASLSST